jgi:hypothetical protein
MTSPGLIQDLFSADRALIGMIHLGALPGSPGARSSMDALIETAVSEARIYHDVGFNGLMIENMHDRPYLAGAVGPEVVAAMAAIGREVRREVTLPLGVQVLAAANREALAVAVACGASFIRAEGWVFGHLADEGLLQASAGTVMRFRAAIGGAQVRVFADIKKKHASHAITADLDIVETAKAAEFFLADAVIVTGTATGRETDAGEVTAVKQGVSIPVLVGSGVSAENLARFDAADGFIVGSSLKQGGVWSNALDPARASAMARAFARLQRR